MPRIHERPESREDPQEVKLAERGMNLPPHYHSELYALVNELEKKISPELSPEVEEVISGIKKAIVKLGVKSQAPGGHFYSPVVNPNSLSRYYMQRWESRQDRNAVRFVNIEAMRGGVELFPAAYERIFSAKEKGVQ